MRTVLLAGGGTGGHIYPNIAVAERLAQLAPDVGIHFLVSDRAGDERILATHGGTHTAVPVRPLPRPTEPWRIPGFLTTWRQSVKTVRGLLRTAGVGAVVATGGFVSGPAVTAARRLSVPTALVNLDAVPGIANRYLSRRTDEMFTTYDSPRLPGAQQIGLPLRASSTSRLTASDARQRLGLEPDRPTLFITGATHGAQSMIEAVQALVAHRPVRAALAGWQVLHQCGTYDATRLQADYDAAGVAALVVDYLDEMGIAWAASDLAIARAGAGTVSEAWANATPTVFLPNPHHPDQRLGRNARPLVDAGGALLVDDQLDASRTAETLAEGLLPLLADDARRKGMREALTRTCPTPGADVIANWVVDRLRPPAAPT